jgi:hypothetical protein
MQKGFEKLEDFAREIERRESEKADFLVPAAKFKMVNDGALEIQGSEKILTDYAHGQVAGKFSIPKRYYDAMGAIPGLRTENVNAWAGHNKDDYLVRTLDNKARALLSSRYRVIDNFPILREAIFPVINEYKSELQVKAYSLTDTKLYLQLIFPSISTEVQKGDILNYGITITNSEVGAGAFDIKSFFWRIVCSNGLISESLIRRNHVGKSIDLQAEDSQIYQDDTIEAEMTAYKLKIRDVVAYALTDRTRIDAMAQKAAGAIEQKISIGAIDAVQNITKHYSGILLESDSENMIKTIVLEQQYNKWGMVNSLTALAHSIESPDRQYQIERAGWDLLNMSASVWNKLAS